MINESSSQYAFALLSLAEEEGNVAAYQTALRDVGAALSANPDFLEFLSSYALPREKKASVLDQTFGATGLKSLVPFLKVLSDHHLFPRFAKILEAFDVLADEALGVKEGIVYSTSPLPARDIALLETAFSQRLQSKVSLRNRVDAALLGGVKVAVDGKIFDGSLQGKLEALQNALAKEGES